MKLRLKECCKIYGITQREIAKKLKISEQRLTALNSQTNFEIQTVEALAESIGCDPIELIQPKAANLVHSYDNNGNYCGIKIIQ